MNFILAISVGPFDGIHIAGGFSNLVRTIMLSMVKKLRVKALIRMRYLTNCIFRMIKE